MVRIDRDNLLGLNSRLEGFAAAKKVAAAELDEALAILADATMYLTALLTSALGGGVIVLAHEMAYEGRVIDKLVQIAELVVGLPGTRLEAITHRSVDGTAAIVLMRAAEGEGIEVSIEVSSEWGNVTPETMRRAEEIGGYLSTALGFAVPVVMQKTDPL